MTSTNIPPGLYPILQPSWIPLSPKLGITDLIPALNLRMSKWRQTVEGLRQGVSGPRWQGAAQPLTAASTLAPLQGTFFLLNATGGAFATTLYLSTAVSAAESVLIFKRTNAANNPTIVTQFPDVFGDTGGNTLTLSAQFQTIRLWCDGAGNFWEW